MWLSSVFMLFVLLWCALRLSPVTHQTRCAVSSGAVQGNCVHATGGTLRSSRGRPSLLSCGSVLVLELWAPQSSAGTKQKKVVVVRSSTLSGCKIEIWTVLYCIFACVQHLSFCCFEHKLQAASYYSSNWLISINCPGLIYFVYSTVN